MEPPISLLMIYDWQNMNVSVSHKWIILWRLHSKSIFIKKQVLKRVLKNAGTNFQCKVSSVLWKSGKFEIEIFGEIKFLLLNVTMKTKWKEYDTIRMELLSYCAQIGIEIKWNYSAWIRRGIASIDFLMPTFRALVGKGKSLKSFLKLAINCSFIQMFIDLFRSVRFLKANVFISFVFEMKKSNRNGLEYFRLFILLNWNHKILKNQSRIRFRLCKNPFIFLFVQFYTISTVHSLKREFFINFTIKAYYVSFKGEKCVWGWSFMWRREILNWFHGYVVKWCEWWRCNRQCLPSRIPLWLDAIWSRSV